MKYFFDTEFIDDGKIIELISIGIVAEDGRTYYAESSEVDLNRAGPWVKENVIPHLQLLPKERQPRSMIKQDIVQFVGPKTNVSGAPEFWAWYGSYDWVVFCQLFGSMVDLPEGWPMLVMDVKQLELTIFKQGVRKAHRWIVPNKQQHNALQDAIWTKKVYERLTQWTTK